MTCATYKSLISRFSQRQTSPPNVKRPLPTSNSPSLRQTSPLNAKRPLPTSNVPSHVALHQLCYSERNDISQHASSCQPSIVLVLIKYVLVDLTHHFLRGKVFNLRRVINKIKSTIVVFNKILNFLA